MSARRLPVARPNPLRASGDGDQLAGSRGSGAASSGWQSERLRFINQRRRSRIGIEHSAQWRSSSSHRAGSSAIMRPHAPLGSIIGDRSHDPYFLNPAARVRITCRLASANCHDLERRREASFLVRHIK